MKPLRIVSSEYYFAIVCSNFNKNEIMAEKWTDSQQAKFLKTQKVKCHSFFSDILMLGFSLYQPYLLLLGNDIY